MNNITDFLLKKQINQLNSPFILPSIPYAENNLEPYISKNTLDFHHKKHHQTYVTNLNNLIKDTELRDKSLTDIIKISSTDQSKVAIFNNAAQVWNHSFYWHCMKQNGGGEAIGDLAKKINEDFGSFDKFKEEFKAIGASQFGSGWVWLVLEDQKLKITKTSNADLPLVHNQIALLTSDVWEHAYYLDYQNRRVDYLEIFLTKLVNWQFSEEIYQNSIK